MKTKQKQARPKITYSAMEKVQAVLSVWTERRKPSHVCSELQINWGVLNHWQNSALAGMLKGLEPKRGKEKNSQPAIGPRLKKLLDRSMTRSQKVQERLKERLEKVTEKKEDSSNQK